MAHPAQCECLPLQAPSKGGIIALLNCAKHAQRSECVPRAQSASSAFGGNADVAQSAEHPPCKRAVTSSILVVGFARKHGGSCWACQQFNNDPGRLPKWPKGTDCKSVVRRLRRFESFTAHYPGSCRDSTISAHIAQSVEHTLGKGEVTSSNLVVGSVAETSQVCEKEKVTWRRQNTIGASRI
jgi:hypothetical protein